MDCMAVGPNRFDGGESHLGRFQFASGRRFESDQFQAGETDR